MSALDDEITKELDNPRECGVCKWYDDLPDDVQASFQRWAADEKVSLAKFHRACTHIDPPLLRGYQSFVRHLRECLR